MRHEIVKICKKLELIVSKEELKNIEKDFLKVLSNAESEIKKLSSQKEKEIVQG